MSTFNYRLLMAPLSDNGFHHCKSQVFPLLDYQYISYEEVRKVDLCESVHDLTEGFLVKTGQKKGTALEVYLSVVEFYLTNVIKCKRGSLADAYRNRALKMIKEIKGKANKDSEDSNEVLLTVFSVYLGLMRTTLPDSFKKEAKDICLFVDEKDEGLLQKIKEYKVKKEFMLFPRKSAGQDLQENDIVYIHNCFLYCNLMELQGEYGGREHDGAVD